MSREQAMRLAEAVREACYSVCIGEDNPTWAINNLDLPAIIAAHLPDLEQQAKDAARLDYVLNGGAFLCKTKSDAGPYSFQLWTQNEDEDYIVLSGKEWFNSPRAAIDAAMKESGHGQNKCYACFGSGVAPKIAIAPEPPDQPCPICKGRGHD